MTMIKLTRHINLDLIPASYTGCLLLMIVLWNGCLKKIDSEVLVDQEQSLTFMSKLIFADPPVFELSATRLYNFTVESRRGLNLRSVELSDEDGNSIEIEPRGTGLYRKTFLPNDPMKVEIGKKYRLTIKTTDGQVYESSLESIPQNPPRGTLIKEPYRKVFYERDEIRREEDVVQYLMDLNLKPIGSQEFSQLKWDVFRIFKLTDTPPFPNSSKTCYITESQDVPELKLINGKLIRKDQVERFFIYDDFVTYHYAEGYYAVIVQESLSETAFQFWEFNKELLLREGTMFELPVGKLRGNFTNLTNPNEEAYGYFYGTVQDTFRIYVSPDEVENPPRYCPPPYPDPICEDCLNAEISTDQKPDWWIE